VGGSSRQERRERLAAIQEEQQRADRRRTRIIIGASIAVAIALVVPTAIVVVNAERREQALQEAAAAPIEGVREYADLSATHTTEDVAYAQTPPVGGDHHPTWQNCGFYDAPVVEEHAVHSLEHGAVWLTYDPDLPAADVDALRDLADRHTYLLVSPLDGVAGVVASAWGVQVQLDGADDERLEPFLLAYLQGPQTPEPGAPCSGGVGA
jgi:hypothetical protein